MKIKTLLHLAGLRPKTREFGYRIRSFDLAREGRVQYAQWLHPSESIKRFGQAEVDHLRTFLAPGDVAIDIGAHTGDTTLPIALAVGPTGRVLALEPNPYVLPVLRVNSGLNEDKTAIEPLPFAATVEDGPIEFEYSDPGYCNGGRHEGIHVLRHGHAFKLTVEGRNLERYLRAEHADILPRVKYIKIDAEGYDATIVESIRGLVQELRPYIKAEMYKHTGPAQRREFFQHLQELGYDVHLVASSVNYFGATLSESQLMDQPHYDVLCAPRDRGLARIA